MPEPTQEQIEKLPKWARGHIADLESRLRDANKALQSAQESEQPTPFYVDEILNTDGRGHRAIKRYVRSSMRMNVEHSGVLLEITLPNGIQGRTGIELTWSAIGQGRISDVVMQPRSFQSVTLFLPKESSNA